MARVKIGSKHSTMQINRYSNAGNTTHKNVRVCIPIRIKSAQKERVWMTSALLSLVLSISMIALSSGECANFKMLFYTGSLGLQKNLLSFFKLPYLYISSGNLFTCAAGQCW